MIELYCLIRFLFISDIGFQPFHNSKVNDFPRNTNEEVFSLNANKEGVSQLAQKNADLEIYAAVATGLAV
jgi:hypothetical protein